MTRHVGVPSCGQRHRNVFIAYLLMLSVMQSSNHCLVSPPCAELVSGPFSFPHPPTPVLLSPYILYVPLNPSPVEEDRWKGGFIRPVHRPSPRGAVDVKSPASTHPVDYRVNPLVFICDGANIHKKASPIIHILPTFYASPSTAPERCKPGLTGKCQVPGR